MRLDDFLHDRNLYKLGVAAYICETFLTGMLAYNLSKPVENMSEKSNQIVYVESQKQEVITPKSELETKVLEQKTEIKEPVKVISKEKPKEEPVKVVNDYKPKKEEKKLEEKVETKCDISQIPEYDIYSIEGRYYRTCRWAEQIEEAEEKYEIPKGLLAGLIMHESMGNPLMLNLGKNGGPGDGGAGLMMFQPGTAIAYDLKVYGKSKKTGRDLEHGKDLRELVKKHKADYDFLLKQDDRFNPDKAINAGGKYLHDLKKKYHTWDKATLAYNQGNPYKIVKQPKKIVKGKNKKKGKVKKLKPKLDFVKEVKKYQQFYVENFYN